MGLFWLIVVARVRLVKILKIEVAVPSLELRRSSWAYAREVAERPREGAPSDPAPDSVRSQRARHRRCGERLCGPRFLLIAGQSLSCALPSKIFCGPSHDLPNSIIWEGQNDKSRTNLLKILVGAAGFEPTTCSTQNCRATRLRYTPISGKTRRYTLKNASARRDAGGATAATPF